MLLMQSYLQRFNVRDTMGLLVVLVSFYDENVIDYQVIKNCNCRVKRHHPSLCVCVFEVFLKWWELHFYFKHNSYIKFE